VLVIVAVLIGLFVGLCVRPALDAYLRFKTIDLLRDGPPSVDVDAAELPEHR